MTRAWSFLLSATKSIARAAVTIQILCFEVICSVLQSSQEATAEARSVALRPQIHDISGLTVVPIGYIAASLVGKLRENSRDLPSDRQHPSPINFGRSHYVRNKKTDGLCKSSAKFVRLLMSDYVRHCQQSLVSVRSRIEQHQRLRWRTRRDATPSQATRLAILIGSGRCSQSEAQRQLEAAPRVTEMIQ